MRHWHHRPSTGYFGFIGNITERKTSPSFQIEVYWETWLAVKIKYQEDYSLLKIANGYAATIIQEFHGQWGLIESFSVYPIIKK
jgi:hypothetical protein